jgi:hypothetical protein
MRFDLLRPLLCLVGLSCGDALPPAVPPPPVRLLFVGNSLTYVNDLPGMVRDLIGRATTAPVEVRSVVYSNFSLTDHRELGEAAVAIRDGGWDLIVLQQGPSSLPESRVQLVAESKWFAGEARAAGGRVGLLMVWPAIAYFDAFDAVRDSYRMAADSAGGRFLAAGEAWRAAWRRDSTLKLYSKDGFHPSPMGSYLAALVVAGAMEPKALDQAPDTLLVSGRPFGVTRGERVTLVAAAREALSIAPALVR